MLRHVIHAQSYIAWQLHQVYIFLSETGMQSEKVCAPDKSFKKTFGEKEGIFKRIKVLKKKQIPNELDLKPFRIGIRVVSPIK